MILKKLFSMSQQERAAINVDEARRRLDAANALLLDVREPDEWRVGHVAGAMLIPLSSVASHAAALPKDRDILVICRTGNRSARAQEQLEGAGFTNVTNVVGGMTAWAEHGFPVTAGEERAG